MSVEKDIKEIKQMLKDSDEARRAEAVKLYELFRDSQGRAYSPDEPEEDNTLPNDGRAQPTKNANKDPKTWKVVPMRDDPDLFKVVDNNETNVADLFHSEKNAQQYVKYFQAHPNPQPRPDEEDCPKGMHWEDAAGKCVPDGPGIPPTPTPTPAGETDGDIKLLATTIGGGVGYTFKSSNKDRYQLVAKLPKDFINILQVGYFKVAKINKETEEISGKNRGDGHSDNTKQEASCYIQGIKYKGGVNSQYEQPHPDNHPLDHTIVTDKPYGDTVVGKWVGLQNKIVFKDGKDLLETWIDRKAGEIDTNGKPGNDWVLFWKTETTQFAGKTNNKGEPAMSFWRLDAIPGGDNQENCESKYCKVYEINPA